MATVSTLSLDNIQGDIFAGLPKKAEKFFFFTIKDGQLPQFCANLGDLLPYITTSQGCLDLKDKIKKEKKRAKDHGEEPNMIEMSAVNISFSQKGLKAFAINDDLGDASFKTGMLAQAAALGDDINNWLPEFKKDIHGLILVTGNSTSKITEILNKVTGIFGVGTPKASIVEVLTLTGHSRPGAASGHEHFGFLDGVSEPAINGLDAIHHRGQETINQGIILLGRDGDLQASERPTWTLDGSFLVFRHLKQLVPEFNDFCERKALPVKPTPAGFVTPTGAELLGARMTGRWKSGAPIDLFPDFDNPVAGADPSQNDDFRYDPYKQDRCPFAAHTRKTNPRADLDIFGGTETRRIARRGIQFGPEVTDAEAAAKKSSDDPKLERGLFFACYQSSTANGFDFIQKTWSNNPLFPPFKDGTPVAGVNVVSGLGVVLPVTPFIPKTGAGVDPINSNGQDTKRKTQGILGTNGADPLKPLLLEDEWVIGRGGEYLFTPSLKALKEIFAQAV